MGDHNLTCRSLRCSGLDAEQNIVGDTRDLKLDVPITLNLRHQTKWLLAHSAGLARWYSASTQ